MNYQTEAYNQQGLGGFFSWLKKAVAFVGEAVATFLPPSIGNVVQDFTNGDGSFGGFCTGNIFDWFETGTSGSGTSCRTLMQDYPLTVLEEYLLDEWVANNFTPIYKSRLEIIANWRTSTPNELAFIKGFNNVNEFISLCQWYADILNTIGEPNSSGNVSESKSNFLLIHADILQETLNDYLSTSGTLFNAQMLSKEVTMSKYSAMGLNTNPQIILTYPQIVEQGGISINLPTTNDTDPITGTNPTTMPSTTIGGVSKTRFWIGVVSGIVVWKLLSSKKN